MYNIRHICVTMSVIIHGLVLFVCVKCSIAEALQQETNSLKYNLKKKNQDREFGLGLILK